MSVTEASQKTDTSPHRVHNVRDSVIRIAGNSQDGIQTVGAMLARLAGRIEMDVMTYMTIPSTISGGPSIFQVHMGSGEVLSAGDAADILVAFYQHSYEAHIDSLRDGGVLIYDSTHVKVDSEALNPRNILPVAVPISGLTIETLGGSSKQKGKNIFLLGLLTKVFRLDLEKVKTLIRDKFGSKDESVVRNNYLALEAGYAYSIGDLMSLYEFEREKETGVRKVAMTGNQALAYGAIAAGVRFGAGYPITPWSEIMEQLRRDLPAYGGTFIQTEDELAAVAAALGAAYGGKVALTGSSGPGISLKTEALSYAVMAEIPLIIVNVQRGGPSTGLPTNVEQSDLNIACFGGHGDSPRVVVAAKNVKDCFELMIEAVQIARKYSVPVVFLSDQAIATRIEAFPMPELDKLMQEQNLDTDARATHKPYDLTGVTHHAPPGTWIADGSYPVVTGLEHDEMGHPSANPKMHQAMTAKRRDKLRQLAQELPAPAIHGSEAGDALLIGWGSTEGIIREAVDRLYDDDITCGSIHLRHLNPLPEGLEKIFAQFERIYVVEMNDQGLYGYGQLAQLLRARYCDDKIQSITKTDGLTFRVSEVVERVKALSKPVVAT